MGILIKVLNMLAIITLDSSYLLFLRAIDYSRSFFLKIKNLKYTGK